MKLNTSKYKITIYSESTCVTCTELKSLLKENKIPFIEKDITKNNLTKGTSIDNRWEFLDITREIGKDGITILVPLIVVESVDGDITYHGAGYDFEEVQEFLELLKPYSI